MRWAALICALAFAAGSSARADDFITYTLSGEFSGTLTNGGTTIPLSPESFSIALTADLNDVENNIAASNFSTPFETVDYTLGNLGNGTYTVPVQLVGANGSTSLSFADASNDLITMTAPSLASYNLETALSLSGITVTTNVSSFNTIFGVIHVPTTGAFTNATLTVTETPEPSSLLLAGMSLALLLPVCLWRRRASLLNSRIF